VSRKRYPSKIPNPYFPMVVPLNISNFNPHDSSKNPINRSGKGIILNNLERYAMKSKSPIEQWKLINFSCAVCHPQIG